MIEFNKSELEVISSGMIPVPLQSLSDSNKILNKITSYIIGYFESMFLGISGEIKVEETRYVSPVQTRYPENNFGTVRHYKAHSDKAVVVFPQRGSGYNFAQLLSLYLASNGIDAYEVESPLRGSRLPHQVRSMTELDISVEDIVDIGYQAVTEGRSLLQGIEQENKGVMGISLGGMYSSILYGIEDQLTSCCLIVTGGNLKEMVLRSNDRLARKLYEGIRKENISLEDLAALDQIDPCAYTRPEKADRLLMINAVYDKEVPEENGQALTEAWGNPQKVSIHADHLSIIKDIFSLLPKIKNHFEKTLSGPYLGSH